MECVVEPSTQISFFLGLVQKLQLWAENKLQTYYAKFRNPQTKKKAKSGMKNTNKRLDRNILINTKKNHLFSIQALDYGTMELYCQNKQEKF